MKVIILAGGLGTRLSEETDLKPKPMVEIGGKPILWHIMKIYSTYGFNEFIILTGYKGHIIKNYFINYYTQYSDLTVDMQKNTVELHSIKQESWRVTLLYTGQNSMTGSRILQAQPYVNNETFMLTYGDGLANINLKKLLDYHRKHGKAITMTSILPEGRFGLLNIDCNNQVFNFMEKPKGEIYNNNGWVNGGFFVCEPKVFDFIDKGDNIIFEQDPLKKLVSHGELYAYKHKGFWKCMDTLKDKNDLNRMWYDNNALWKIWKD
ncbi:glucose-1-phosphate cytidylyltransferase [Campylobacter jejuni]|nr:glucose-1-phosphate cytidylyltransferase [Campylobacter jejuni]